MRVTVFFMGPLASYTGGSQAAFELPAGARYGDLLDRIASAFGERFPSGVWDREARAFRPGILAIGVGRDLDDRAAPLADRDEIRIVPLVGGG